MQYKSYILEENFNPIEKIFLFYGENFGLKNEFKKKIKAKYKNSKIINYYQDEIIKDETIFLNEVNNFSLFEEEKIFFINQASDKILEIILKFEKEIEGTKVYLFSEVLDKKSKLRNFFEKSKLYGITACYLDNEITIKKIIQKNLKDFKILSPQAINIIYNNCGLDRIKLSNEIDKIKTFFQNKELQLDKLEEILNLRTNDDFNVLKDEAFKGNKQKTNTLLSDTIFEEEKNIYYLNLINQKLDKLAQINQYKFNSNYEAAITKVKPPIFWKDKPIIIEQARRWDANKIRNILAKTHHIEIQIKSNSIINKKILLKKLVLDVCNLANS
tara:strand:- start:512 stop:1498 length:987 start_codon:yes stop_codon:yes gene_type:complete